MKNVKIDPMGLFPTTHYSTSCDTGCRKLKIWEEKNSTCFVQILLAFDQ